MAAGEQPEDDAALVLRCRNGDQRAWVQLVGRYQRLVYAVALRARLDPAGAADVFQTVFARLVEHLPRIDDPTRLQAWLVTTARREAVLLMQRSRRNVSLTDDEGAQVMQLVDDGESAEDELAALQRRNGLRNALERLDERCRTLLTLLFDDSDTRPAYDAIAQRLGIPVGSIGPTRARCLGKLRTLAEAEGCS
jgi:RNA polymerase sigma factor (sigma-70 family)